MKPLCSSFGSDVDENDVVAQWALDMDLNLEQLSPILEGTPVMDTDDDFFPDVEPASPPSSPVSLPRLLPHPANRDFNTIRYAHIITSTVVEYGGSLGEPRVYSNEVIHAQHLGHTTPAVTTQIRPEYPFFARVGNSPVLAQLVKMGI